MSFQPPQIDYREHPSAGNSDALDHPDREDPNRGGTVFGPQPDDSFHAYDTVGDAEPWPSPSAPVEHSGSGLGSAGTHP
jgi:hypothetical protein